MKLSTVIVLLVVVAAGSYGLTKMANKDGSGSNKEKSGEVTAKGGAADPIVGDVERFRVPVEGPVRGPENAKVTIVAFSDFQCPFCSRVVPTLDKIMKEYPGQVRMYFRHNPLPFHPDAPLAAEAALAAQDQGKFWEMHDKLFTNQQNIKRPDLEKYAGELGLDMGKFKSALDSSAHKAPHRRRPGARAPDRRAGHAELLHQRPAHPGAQPFEEFKKVDRRRDRRAPTSCWPRARRRASSTRRSWRARRPRRRPRRAGPGRQGPGRRSRGLQGPGRRRADEGRHASPRSPSSSSPTSSARSAAASSRRSTACSKDYGNDVSRRVPAQPAALPPERHARRRGRRGRARAGQVLADARQAVREPAARSTAPNLEKYAQELGLDMAKFKARARQREVQGRASRRTWTTRAKFGARGTPTFFINGRNFRGAQPLEAFKSVIDEEIKKADAKLKSGTPRGQLYAALTQDGLAKAAPPPAAAGRARASPTRTRVYQRRGQGRAGQGRQGRAGHHRGVLRLPVPVLPRVEPTIDQGHGGVQGQGPHRLARPAAALPPERACRPPTRRSPPASRASSGRCTTSCSPTSRRWTAPTSRSTRRSSGLNMGKFKAALDSQQVQGGDRGRRGRGQQDRRARHAGVLHQRQVPVGRAAVRGLQGQDRRASSRAPRRWSPRARPRPRSTTPS